MATERGDTERPRSDGALVVAARGGSRDAFAAIYDRYADRIHDYCAALLRNRADAADATQDTFLLAAERLGQLRDVDRLRPWLYAIARSRCSRRFRARTRVVPVEEVTAVADPSVPPDGVEAAELADLRALLWDAAAGLPERDQTLLTLQLRHDLGTGEIAEVLDVAPNHASVLLGRLREQLERSLGALLVARLGARDCAELADILRDWDGTFSPLVRKRVARHVDACETCEARRARALSPAALLAAVPLLAAPPRLRDAVLAAARLPGDDRQGGGGYRGGDPPSGTALRRLPARVVALVAVLALLLVPGDRPQAPPPAADAPEAVASGEGAVAPVGPTPSTPAAPPTAGPPTEDGQAGDPGPVPTTQPAPSGAPPGIAAPSTEDPSPDGETDDPAPDEHAPAPDPAPPDPSPSPSPSPSPTAAPSPAILAVDTDTLVLDADQDEAVFEARNDGGEPLAFEAAASAGWLSVDPAAATLGPGEAVAVTVTADRSSLPEGESQAELLVTSTAGDAAVTVVVATERPPRIEAAEAEHSAIGARGCPPNDWTTVTADVADESALDEVFLVWTAPDGKLGETAMVEREGRWTAPLGPFETPGTASWYVRATDSRGNTAISPVSELEVTRCP